MELPSQARDAFVDERGGDDADLKARLRAMLAAAADEDFLAHPTGEPRATAPRGRASTPANLSRPPAAADDSPLSEEAPLQEGPGTRIGSYKLLQQIGEGGFGVVFLAEQEEPVRRKVALKILKLGMDTRQVVARFEQERQALALMDHPHIARVFDAGATGTGRPYFVMELVQGDPIVAYCDAQRLTIDQRLELMAQVCSAVQHAHQKGVIHRDLKPTNVLVGTLDGRPHAKVIDFGIAKATSQKMTDKTLFTEHRQVIGTFQYMSPEQAEGSLDVDTRTDVYALGVLLYELLTGSTPFDATVLQNAMFGEIQRLIREVDPPRPSTRISQSQDRLASLAAVRGIEPRRLGLVVRGDLDWIVMKALEKNRARRYESANELAQDLRRHLAGEAVLAAPPSAGYLLATFVRRHRGLVGACAAVAVALLAGVVAFAWQARVARAERDVARAAEKSEAEQRRIVDEQRIVAKARAEEFELVAEFQAKMLQQIDPIAAGRRLRDDVPARYAAALASARVPETDRAALVAQFGEQWSKVNTTDAARAVLEFALIRPSVTAIEEQFAAHPGVRSKLQNRLAGLCRDLGMYDSALTLVRAALEVRRRDYGEEHAVTLKSINDTALVLYDLGRPAEAEPLYREALAKCVRALGEDDALTSTVRDNLAVLLTQSGRSAEAEPLARRAFEARHRVLGEDHPDTLNSMSNLALVLEGLGRYPEAELLYRDVLARRRRVLGDEDSATMTTVNNLGALLKDEYKLAEAEPLLREAVATNRRVLGEDHPDRLVPLDNLGIVLQAQGRLPEAEACFREVLAARERLLGKDHPSTLTARTNMGNLLMLLDRAAEAEVIHREAFATRRRVLGARHPETIGTLNSLAMALQMQGKLDEAVSMEREVLEGLREVLGPDHQHTFMTQVNLGSMLQQQGRSAEAEPLLRSAMASARRAFGAGHPIELTAASYLAKVLAAESRFADVVTLVAPAIPHFRRASGERRASSLARMLTVLGKARGKLATTAAEFAVAEAELREAEGLLVGVPGQKPTDRGDCLQALVDLYTAWELVEPGQGHAEASSSWRTQLDAAAK